MRVAFIFVLDVRLTVIAAKEPALNRKLRIYIIFRKRGQPPEVHPNFRNFFLEFPEFSVEWFAFGNWTTAAKTSEDTGFNESYNGSARVINLCTFRSQPMQNKQLHHLDVFIVEASIYRQTSDKIPK